MVPRDIITVALVCLLIALLASLFSGCASAPTTTMEIRMTPEFDPPEFPSHEYLRQRDLKEASR